MRRWRRAADPTATLVRTLVKNNGTGLGQQTQERDNPLFFLNLCLAPARSLTPPLPPAARRRRCCRHVSRPAPPSSRLKLDRCARLPRKRCNNNPHPPPRPPQRQPHSLQRNHAPQQQRDAAACCGCTYRRPRSVARMPAAAASPDYKMKKGDLGLRALALRR